MNFGNSTWRNRRTIHNQNLPFGTMHCSISSYSTESKMDIKSDMKTSFCDEELIKKFNAIPEPIRKNLAETVVTVEENNMKKKKINPEPQGMYYDTNMGTNNSRSNTQKSDLYQSIAGITGFITNFFGAISGAMFHKRSQSPVSQYYECFDHEIDRDRERSPSLAWQMSKYDDQNKNEQPQEQFSPPNDNMNNCRTVAAHCEDKLTAVRNLLKCPTVQNKPKVRTRRPRRVFVEPNSVEDHFEDAFSPEDFISLSNDEFVEYYTVSKNIDNQLCEVEVPLTPPGVLLPRNGGDKKDETEICQSSNKTLESTIVTNPPVLPEKINTPTIHIPESKAKEVTSHIIENSNPVLLNTSEGSSNNSDNKTDCKREIITSCEDKMARLKLLLENRTKNTKTNKDSADSAIEPVQTESVAQKHTRQSKTIPIEKVRDKRFKNPHRLSKDKRKHSRMKRTIQDDILFAQEVDCDDVASSIENLPSPCPLLRLPEVPSVESLERTDYFDELKGRFRSTSTTESEDSFQIVFSDSPSKTQRSRKVSDCDSEDSVVFEDSPDSCYTSNDVFGDDSTTEESDSECSDSDSDMSDLGFVSGVPKLSHSLSKAISNLTDISLYDDDKKIGDDEVDCAVKTLCDVLPPEVVDLCEVKESAKTGLLLTEAKKKERKRQPSKNVTFSSEPPKVHVMRVWAFAARQARAGHWERHSLDRERFKRRIADVDMAVSWVLKPQHRSRVMFQRFMPWWNAQRRKEIAEKKQKEEEEKNKREKEKQAEMEKCKSGVEGKVDDIVNVGTVNDKNENVLDEKSNLELTKNTVIVANSINVVDNLKKDLCNGVGTVSKTVDRKNINGKVEIPSPVIISNLT